ncbi:MAG: S-layer homology domain-containing protein, partial [Evtepia sp.]|nr:S-layer homology domain-containing protein [Evtepia sp.]
EVCKMICVALNGGKEPTLSVPATPTFKDVRNDANSAWAEKYIESCVAQGIVGGVGNGMFQPSQNVTGSQLAKMLLVGLGYKADNEGFGGANWDTKVNVIASAKGLYEGLETLDTSAALSRDSAAQMIWNALNAYEVEYKNQLTTVNGQLVGTEVVQDRIDGDFNRITWLEDKYESKTVKGFLTAVNYDDEDNTYTTKVSVSGKDTIFDATKDYSDLMGQQVKVMYTNDNKTKETVLLGVYPTSDNKTVTTIYGDAKIAGNTATIDGEDYDITGITTIATNGTVIKSADYDNWDNFPYAEVTLVDNDKDKVYEYAVVNPFKVVQLTSLTAKKAYFENALNKTNTYSVDRDKLSAYDGIAEDDYVYLTEAAYTVSGDMTVVKADTVSGKVTGTKGATGEKSIKVDNAWYEQAAASVGVPNNGDDLEYVVVANGYFFATEGATGSTDKLALVLKVGSQDFDGDYRDVKLLLSDGTTKTTKAYVKDGSTKSAPVLKTLYTYTENSDGYVLKAINTPGDIGMDSVIKGTADVKYNSQTNKVGTTRLAADAQVFVLYDQSTDKTTYKGKVITGAEADKWANGDYWFTVAYVDGNVKVLVASVGTQDIPNATDDSLYGVILSTPYSDIDKDDNDVWVIDLLTESGVVEGIVVDETEFDATALAKNQLVTFKMDGNEYVDFAAAPAKTAAAIVGAVTDVDGKYVTVQYVAADKSVKTIELKTDSDDSTILYFDSDAATVASGSIKEATKKDADNYYANIMVIYKTATEEDGTNLIWGAAVDVNNQLQNADDEDVLIPVAVTKP